MTTRQLTIESMIAIEPRIQPILADARKARELVKDDPRRNVWLDYRDLKRSMSEIIGNYRRIDDQLQSCEAYNVAIAALSDALGV